MIKIINIDSAEKSEILTRDIKLESGVEAIVADIIKNVKENGDAALKEYSAKFDGVCPENLRVTQAEIDAAYENEDKALIETLELAKKNIWAFHEKQLRSGFEIKGEDGTVSGQKITPIEKVGIYVPGGTASYPSTVLMNAIPAKIAGVKEIIMVTPRATFPRLSFAPQRLRELTQSSKQAVRRLLRHSLTARKACPRQTRLSAPATFLLQRQKECSTDLLILI